MVTDAVSVPTIGIGAGGGCDGQVLVLHDLLGLEDRVAPKFVRRYASLEADGVAAVAAFAADVRGGRFPNDDESYHLSDDVADVLGLYAVRALIPAPIFDRLCRHEACRARGRDPSSSRRAARSDDAATAGTVLARRRRSTAPVIRHRASTRSA